MNNSDKNNPSPLVVWSLVLMLGTISGIICALIFASIAWQLGKLL